MTKDKIDKHTIDWYDEVLKKSREDMSEVSKSMSEHKIQEARIQAFFDLIGYTEGTDRLSKNRKGYDIIGGNFL